MSEPAAIRKRAGLRGASLVAAMLLATCGVALLASWDATVESDAALADFAQEQATLAEGIAAGLASRAAVQPPPTQAELLKMIAQIDPSDRRLVLLRPPRAPYLLNAAGAQVQSPPILRALDEAAASSDQKNITARLERPEAAALGLPLRMAQAGLAKASLPDGNWQIAVISTADRVRDRQLRERWRLWLAIGVAAALVLAFGGLALRQQRRELRLESDLRLSSLIRERDAHLRRVGQSANLVALASGVAHEVSTPLGVIVGRAEQLRDRSGNDERSRRAAEGILEQAERINQVVRGFLSLARGGSPELKSVPAEEIVRGAAALCEHRFSEAGVQLQLELPSSLPAVRCDLRLLQHALINLLLNACDASPAGSEVILSAAAQGDSIDFIVRDRGAGITLENAARALEPFFTTKPEGKGTGMGLAIASEIAQSHRGTVSLAPDPAGGTRALIQIPLGAPDA